MNERRIIGAIGPIAVNRRAANRGIGYGLGKLVLGLMVLTEVTNLALAGLCVVSNGGGQAAWWAMLWFIANAVVVHRIRHARIANRRIIYGR
jgi:hypothetical protein